MSEKQTRVYNGFADLHLSFDGRWFDFPQGKVTVLEDVTCTAVDEYKREHPTDPDPSAMLEYTFKAREFAQMLLTRHGNNLIEDGSVLLLDREPTDTERKVADSMGRVRKITMVKEALAAQNAALNSGGRMTLDKDIVNWLIEYDVPDATYNPKPEEAKNDKLVASIAEAIAAGSRKASEVKQPELAGAKK